MTIPSSIQCIGCRSVCETETGTTFVMRTRCTVCMATNFYYAGDWFVSARGAHRALRPA
jgi:hypothetical protein